MSSTQFPSFPRALARLGALYLVLALGAILLSRLPGSIATLWFANALAMAYLLAQPARRWPAMLAVCGLALLLANLCVSVAWPAIWPFLPANLAEIAFGAALVRRSGCDTHFCDSPERFMRFIALACCLPPLLGATLGAAALAWTGTAGFMAAWPSWYAGSTIGAVALLPLALLATHGGAAFWRKRIGWSRTPLYLALAVAVPMLSLSFLPFPFVYIMLPLMAAAVVLPFEGAALAVCTSALTTGCLVASGHVAGPAAAEHWALLKLYLPILMTMVPPLLLAASVRQGRLREEGRRGFEAALQHKNQELQTVIDHMPAIVAYWDADLRNRFSNRSLHESFGLTAEQMRGKHFAEIVGAARFADSQPDLERALAGQPVMYERTRPDAGGQPRDVVVSYVPDLQRGKVAGFYSFITDITPLKQAQRQQQAAQAQLQSIIDAASDFMIIATGVDGLIQVFSAGAERALGWRAAELVGLHDPLILHDADEVRSRRLALEATLGRGLNDFALFTELALHGGSDRRPWTYVRKDGTHMPVSLMVTAMRDAEQRVVGFLGIATDITQQQHLQDTLVQAKELAESASRAKSEFVANMSHEIRTPLNAVLGMAHLLGTTPLAPTQREYLEMIRVSGQSLLGILNDILDFSKIEAGHLALEPGPFELGDVLGALANIMTVNAGEKDLELAIGIAPGVPPRLIGDELRLQQVLVNLTGNAIKFTAQGEVSVLVELAPAPLRDGQAAGAQPWQEPEPELALALAPPAAGTTLHLRFVVRDTGIGMDPAQQAGIFQAFSQADNSMTRRFGGTGLGLAICTRLVSLMGGQIGVTSAPGQGSEFSVTLPLQVAVAPPDGARRDAGADLHLLVVDDNRTSRDYLCQTIRAWNWRADSAASGAEAIARVQALQARGVAYDAVLVDWHMPGLDGLGTLRALRALQPAPATPVFLMAGAYGRGKLLQQDDTALADAILVKPVTGSVLFDSLHAMLGRHEDREADGGAARASPFDPRPAPRPPQLHGVRLLLVEDNPLNQLVARGVLEHAGASVDVAEHGEAALALLRGGARYDLILMDVQMPVMDGFAATRAIRDELGLSVPVLAMTAGVMLSEREQCSASGMDDFIAKPLDMEQLFDCIARHLPPGGADEVAGGADQVAGVVDQAAGAAD